MLSRQSLIALAVALILGLAAVFVANSYLSQKEQKVVDSGTTKVAVATVPLAYGVDITPDKVRFVDYPNSSIPPGSFPNPPQLFPGGGKPRIALLPISINEPILASKITGQGQ